MDGGKIPSMSVPIEKWWTPNCGAGRRSATRSGAIIAILPGQSPDDAQTEEAQPDHHEHYVRGHLEYFDENDAHAGKRDECPGRHEASTGGATFGTS
jgi:hypothetical protein